MSKNKDTVTLKEYLENRLDDAETKVTLKIESLKEATILARENMDERLSKMNEFRDTLKDQNSTFITKPEYCAFTEKVDKSIRSLEESRAENKGKADQSSVNKATIIAIIGMVLAVVGILTRFL